MLKEALSVTSPSVYSNNFRATSTASIRRRRRKRKERRAWFDLCDDISPSSTEHSKNFIVKYISLIVSTNNALLLRTKYVQHLSNPSFKTSRVIYVIHGRNNCIKVHQPTPIARLFPFHSNLFLSLKCNSCHVNTSLQDNVG